MKIEILASLLERDLNKLKTEILTYDDEPAIWGTEKKISNSAGNLCLHLIGNLNTYFGAVLGNTGYVRDRDLEFSAKDIPRQELVSKLEQTILMVNKTLSQLKDADLEKEYPILVFEKKISTAYFLTHLSSHLAYHLGQINYHRRLLDA